ncbi:hypothetical protein Ptr902_09754 [Pyrenophora tritici-repentis]|nr:hypothetical protein PtrSN001A_002903 [Pyrenophora tritici-repentis]KAI1584073.1 hypothetical protein PtrEW7m1_002891 [Pyrenophora tritici-repentis]KAI1604970.1 hypothetical protein PtrCC142_002818 [Pyrenophora tritici-repentis]KAI2478788.1 hypothetical protein Ptr902_09754 [Pyrenophora tritici-repentis]PWO29166.1 Bul1-N domain containing protein [Pyrenophora tritici-repentis]
MPIRRLLMWRNQVRCNFNISPGFHTRHQNRHAIASFNLTVAVERTSHFPELAAVVGEGELRLWDELLEFLVTRGDGVCESGAVGEFSVFGVAVLDGVVAGLAAGEEEGVTA